MPFKPATANQPLAITAGVICLIMIAAIFGQAGATDQSGRWLAVAALFVAAYFIPSIVAWGKRDFNAICALNVLLGWTPVGWVVALCWALKRDVKQTVFVQPSAQNFGGVGAPILCPDCGKYNLPKSSFCSTCGAKFFSKQA
jgi:hypothetical protein